MRIYWPFRNDGTYGKWNLRRDRAMQRAVLFFAICVIGQASFWQKTHTILPEMGIVPAVPGERTVRALSFGDEEAFFRLLALNIQNSGDTFGRFTALYKYDFNKLYHWFHLLDELDNTSNYLPSMATYYFSQTQNRDDVRYIVDYLDEHTIGRAQEKWWWVAQASYLAEHKLNDSKRALDLAERLRGIKGIPMWAQQLAAFVHEKRGEFDEALGIIQEILKDPDQYSQGELNFMKYFIGERLGKMKEVEGELKKIQAIKDKRRAQGIPDVVPHEEPPPDVGAAKAPG
jgi:tetratricopeptide (TPR) repeat protein